MNAPERPPTPRERSARSAAREIAEFLSQRATHADGGREALAQILGAEFGTAVLERLRVSLAARNARGRMRR